MTSHDVVARVRRAYHLRAVGHTGTLDPFATGLLIVLLGRGTRVARFVERQDKSYYAVARLGVVTDTDDLTGREIATSPGPLPDRGRVAEALARLVGPMSQRPPAYSAKRVAGERSHRLARRGAAVALAPVEVMVHALDLLECDGDRVAFRARVSAGTYVRALARDLGERLGVGAHVVELRREAIGDLRVEEAVPVADLRPETPLRPLRDVLAHLPALSLTETEWEAVRHGRPIPRTGSAADDTVVLLHEGEVGALAARGDGCLHPRVVLAAP